MAVELINCLVNTLNENEINYCHWKSNYTLSETLSGELDLDLLVDRQSLSMTLIILLKLGFKSAMIKAGAETPGISHYYGFDPSTGQLIHIHLFSNLLTGESFVKSHLLPFETMLFENIGGVGQIKVASKPAELVLFILRTFIKYGSLLDLIYLQGKSESIKAELLWLQDGNEISESLQLLKKYCQVMDEKLFVKCVDALKTNNSLLERILLAQRVRKCLRIYKTHSPFAHLSAYFQVLWEKGVRRLSGNKKNKVLRSGGIVIAFVGPEATGKSTLVSESNKWLGQVFAMRTIHAGKPPSSWITAPANMILPLLRQWWPRFRTTRLEGHGSSFDPMPDSKKLEGFTGLIYAVRSLGLAWDRRQLLVRSRRFAANGEIIICDRYPSETIGSMDSPRLLENPTKTGPMSVIYNWLARLEHQLYREIPPPDVVLKLKVSVGTAKKRNQERIKVGKETDTYLESRHRQSRDWRLSGTKYIFEIDTEKSLAETILNVKKNIWDVL